MTSKLIFLLIMCSQLWAVNPGWTVDPDLIAWYPLNETYTNTDPSGLAANLVATGPLTYGVKDGYSCVTGFQSSAFFLFPASLQTLISSYYGTSLSIEMKIWTGGYPAAARVPFYMGGAANNNSVDPYFVTNSMVLNVYQIPPNGITPGQTVPSAQWATIGITMNSNAGKLWVNNNSSNLQNIANDTLVASGIGAETFSTNLPFIGGYIRDVKIYKAAKSLPTLDPTYTAPPIWRALPPNQGSKTPLNQLQRL